MREWTEEIGSSNLHWRITKGSSFFSGDFWEIEDHIAGLLSASVNTTTMEGFRLASAVSAEPNIRRAPHDY